MRCVAFCELLPAQFCRSVFCFCIDSILDFFRSKSFWLQPAVNAIKAMRVVFAIPLWRRRFSFIAMSVLNLFLLID